MTQPINPDHILSALYRRLSGDPGFRSMVRTIDKGPRRRVPAGQSRPANPSCTVHILTSPIDLELDTVRCTAVVNVYMDDLADGRMDALGLGQRAERVIHLLHRAHLPTHPAGRLEYDTLRFLVVHAQESLLLPSDLDGEHLVSIRVSLIVQRKG